MKVTREMKDAVNNYMHYKEDWLDDEGYIFYYKCLFEYNMDLIDADEYAMLNTLIGYDIGVENARSINTYLWEQDIETLELTGYDDDKNEIKKAIDALNLDIDLSKWKYGDIDGYEYYVITE